ncbi:MAG: iron-containing alcohol dehydrogenase [Nitrospinota bacterium]
MRHDKDLEFDFRSPTKIVFGAGSSRDVGAELSELGRHRAVIVTDRVLAENTDVPEKIKKGLGPYCAGIYSDVEPNSSFDIVNNGADYARGVGADCVVSVGGGSAIDSAKGISVLLKSGGSIQDFAGASMLTEPQTPHIAVPTTAGTGSEMTYVAVIMDRENKRKTFITDNRIFPNTAILDPELTVSLPPHLTGATGMDAMTHALEALHSAMRNPFSDAAALHAIRLIKQWLVRAVERPNDIMARGQMLIAASLAGSAFSNAMVGVAHAIAQSIGAIAGTHHGLACSIVLPHCMRFNAQEFPGLYVDAAVALAVFEPGMQPAEASERAAQEVYDIANKCGLKTTLSGVGVGKELFNEIAELSMSDGAILFNPRIVTDKAEIMNLLQKAF